MRKLSLSLALLALCAVSALAQPQVSYFESYSSGTGLQYYVEFDQTMDTNTLTTGTIKAFGSMSGAFPVDISVNFYDPGAEGGGALKSVGGSGAMRTASAYHYMDISLGRSVLPGETVTFIMTTGVRNASNVALAKAFIRTSTTGFTSAQSGYEASVAYAAGTDPNRVLTADVDGDGDADLATLASNSQYVSIRLNNGDGSFSAAAEYDLGVGLSARGGAFGDINGDGHIDLIVANNSTSTNLTPILNDGDGTFTVGTAFIAFSGFNPDFVDFADLDGDGDLDLMLSSTIELSPSNHVAGRMLNNGSGSFSSLAIWQVGTAPVSMTAADIDGDDDLDLAVANMNGNSVSLIINNGTGSFSTIRTLSSDLSSPRRIAFADLDDDGDLDMYVANHNGNNVLRFLNDGNAGATAPFASFPTAFSTGTNTFPNSVAFADADADGNTDMVVAGADLFIFPGNGSGGFEAMETVDLDFGPTSMVVADFSGTGSADFAFIDAAGDELEVVINAVPPNVVSVTPTNDALDVSPTADITVVFDRDMNSATLTAATVRVEGSRSGTASGTYGYNAGTKTLTISGLDFMPGEVVSVSVSSQVLGTTGASTTPYAMNYTIGASGNGYFSFSSSLNTGSTSNNQLYSADVDGDGDDDLIGIASNVVHVYENISGVFNPFSSFALGSEYPDGAHVGDFDNDGDPDMIVWSFNTTASLLQNDGAGNFTRNTTFNFGNSGSKTVTVADFDGDGNLDLAYNFGNAILNVSYGAGDFTFESGSYTNLDFNGSYLYPKKLVAGDFNHDGRMDVAGFNDQRDQVFVMLNNGNRSYSASEAYTVPANTYDIAVADLAGTAHPDLVVASYDGRSFSILTGSGDGTFSNPITYGSLPYKLNRISTFDFSGNGKPDLVIYGEEAVEGSELLFMAYNDGNGGFGNQVTFSIPNQAPEWYYGLSSGFAVLDADSDGALDIASRLTDGGNQYIAFIENAAPSGGGSAPTVAASAPASNSITHRSARLSWTNGDGLRRLIVMKAGAPVDATLVDDSYYGPNPTFGQGTQIGSGNYLVFGGNGNSTSIQGLTGETTYHYAIYEINGIPGEEKILTTTPAIGSFTTTAPPPVFRISEGSISFTKANNADWTQEANQDRITDNVWITRGNTRGIFNIALESGYDTENESSPIGTLWAFGTADDIDNLNFQPWKASHGGDAPSIVDEPMVMYLVGENAYVEVLFTSWTQESGGGFSYTRGDGDFPAIPAVDFEEEAGHALAFDGVDDYMLLNRPSSISSFPTSATFEMWVKPGAIPTSGDAVFASGEQDNHQIGIDATGKFFATFYDNDYRTATGTTVAEVGKWYHIAASIGAGGQLRLYVNGELEGSTTFGTAYSSFDYFAYGRADYDEDSYFQGELDEIRIWTVERTASQIRANMFNPNSGANSLNTVAVFQLNEGTGTTVSDLVNGYEVDLTAAGGSASPTWATSTIPIGGISEVATGIQTGTAEVGGATLTFNTPFENPVDVFFNEITTEPNLYPDGFTASLGGKYFVIDLVGEPGTFSLDLTLTFGEGVITAENEAAPGLLKLYRRSSGSGGAWTEIASASSAVASTGVVTWPGITSFSEFMAVQEEPAPILGIDDLSVVAFRNQTYTFDAGLFEIDASYGDDTLGVMVEGEGDFGQLFVDVNDNGMFDEATDRLLNDNTAADYTPSNPDEPLVYLSDSYGTATATLYFASGSESDTLTVTFTVVESTPTLEGQADEAGWYLLANPLDTPLGTLFSSIWTQGAVNSDAPTGQATLYTYNPLTSAYEAVTTDLDTTKARGGQGILAYVYAFDDYNAGIPEGGGWPKNLTNEGNPFTSNAATVRIRNEDSAMPEGTSGTEGFNLFGNPYAWPLSADSLIATLKRADPLANSYVYRWNQPYQAWQLVTGGEIHPYESVFIRAIESGLDATLQFAYDDRFDGARKDVVQQPFTLTLTHAESGLTSGFSLRSDDQGSVGIDPYDGYYMGSYSRNYANLFSTVGDQSLVIHNLPTALDQEIGIPVHLHASVTGTFDLTWDATTVPAGWTYVLVDPSTGAETNLASATTHRFERDTRPQAGSTSDEAVFLLRVRGPATTGTEDLAGIPTRLELHQNFPNPFNPSTTIRFGLPEQADVKLEVYDLLGRRVAVLDQGMKPAGFHQVAFDASRMASGVYLYRLTVGGRVLTNRMLLIK